MSKTHANPYNDEYKRLKYSDPEDQVCIVCGKPGHKEWMDPHHIRGRGGANLLIYRWVHFNCHSNIHENEKLSKEKGWMK